MGTSNVALGMVIGGTVGATFGKALSDSSAKIDAFKKRAETVRGFHNLIGDTIRLRDEMAKTADKSSEAFGKLIKAHDANIAKIKSHGMAVDQLDKDYVRLGRTVKGLELGAAGRAKIGEGVAQAKESMRAGAAVTAAVAAPTMVSANYQAIVRDIAIKGGIARTDKETSVSDSIRRDARDTGMDRNTLAEAVNTLVAGGMAVDEAVAQARSMGRFAVGQNADATDTAKLVLALRQAGIVDPAAMEKALGKIAVAGDLGSFEAKDMAKNFAVLMPQMTAFGMSGERATIELANMLQTQMKAAGSTDEAANNLANLLSKITGEDTKKKFEAGGFDLEKSLRANIAAGLDPVTAFLGIVQEATKKTDPAKAKELAALQGEIAKAQDPAAAQKMLDGYLAMAGLSEYISDRQAKQAALAALQNQKLHRENLRLIQSTDGQAKIEKDLADRREASQQKWREVGQAMDEALAKIGDAIRPVTDFAADGFKGLGQAISWVAQEAPLLANGLVIAGAAFAATLALLSAKKIGGGLLDVAKGAWMSRGSDKLLKGLETVAGNGRGGKAVRIGGSRKKGVASKVADALGAAVGANGTPVFVTNWPGGGLFDLPDSGKRGPLSPKEKIERARLGRMTTVAEGAADVGQATGKTGIMARIGAAVAGVMGAGKAALAAPTLGAVAGGGTGTMAAAGGMVTAAGAAGYGVGTVVNKMFIEGTPVGDAIGRGVAKTLAMFGNQDARQALAAERPAAIQAPAATAGTPGATNGKPVPAPALTFSPTIQVTVNGDVKDPRQIANDLMPHLRRMFDQLQAQSARAAMFDPAHA